MHQSPDSPPPLSHLEFYILLVLTHGEAHIYKIKHKVEELSKGSLKPRDSTIYSLISRMSDQGLIEFAGERPTDWSSKVCMHYSLGHHGQTALLYELERLRHAITIADSAGLLDQPIPSDLDNLLLELEVGSNSA